MDHLTLIHAETQRFMSVLRDLDQAAPVPTCPDWTVADLAWHLTDVHAFWARILATGALAQEEADAIEASPLARPDSHADVMALLDFETDALIAQLAAKADDEPAWSWFGTDQTVGFTRRMQVHEATMHRVDAEAAAGIGSAPIAADVAADAIAHGVEVMLSWWGTQPGFEFQPTGGIVQLSAADADPRLIVGGLWIGTGRSGKQYQEPGAAFVADGESVATITGTAEELARWVWGRGPEPATDGAREALGAVRAAQKQGMQ